MKVISSLEYTAISEANKKLIAQYQKTIKELEASKRQPGITSQDIREIDESIAELEALIAKLERE